MAASPTPPNLSNPPTPPQRSDSANFAARGDSFLSYIGTALITELRAALDWVRDVLSDVRGDAHAATTAATAATMQAGVAGTAAADAQAWAYTADQNAQIASNEASASATSAAAALASQTAAAASAATASTKATEAANSAAAAATSAANVGYADVTSVSAHNLTTGTKVFVVNEVRAYLPSLPVRLVHSGSVYMDGVITSISGKNVTVSVSQSYGAAGTYSPWAFAVLEGINAPTKTGGGASGSWGIDITGNAATASAAQAGSALEAAINARAPLASPVFTGTPAVPTATAGTNTTQAASTAFVATAIANLVASSPSALDTLNELAAALGNDPSFAATMNNALAQRVVRVSANRPGVTKLYRNDGDDAYNVQTSWTGARWRLKGYNSDTYHGEVEVSYADQVPWTGVSGRPTAVSAFSNDNGYLTAGTLPGIMTIFTAGSVGSYALCRQQSIVGDSVDPGHISAGSRLILTNASGGRFGGYGQGTWRCMGAASMFVSGTSGPDYTTLWLRIA